MNRSALALTGILVFVGAVAVMRGSSLGRLADGAATTTSAPIATRTQIITAVECAVYAIDGKVEICHATGSHYVSLVVSAQACEAGHGGHEADFIAPINGCEQ